MRHHPMIGIDYTLDILLIYRKYEGRKMTVQVRRHAYVRNTYTHMIFRENDLSSSIFIPYKSSSSKSDDDDRASSSGFFESLTDSSPSAESTVNNSNSFLNRLLPSFLLNLVEKLRHSSVRDDDDWEAVILNTRRTQQQNNNNNNAFQRQRRRRLERIRTSANEREDFYVEKSLARKWINFVVPLTGRWEIFKRFMSNYERVCLERGERTRLAVVLFENERTPRIRDDSLNHPRGSAREYAQSELIELMFTRLRDKHKHVRPSDLQLVVNASAFSRSIGCELGAARFSPDSLIFFVDVDIVFTAEFLLRARLNTIEFKQVCRLLCHFLYDKIFMIC